MYNPPTSTCVDNMDTPYLAVATLQCKMDGMRDRNHRWKTTTRIHSLKRVPNISSNIAYPLTLPSYLQDFSDYNWNHHKVVHQCCRHEIRFVPQETRSARVRRCAGYTRLKEHCVRITHDTWQCRDPRI